MLGPVAVSALVFMLVVSPLMRGGNRHVALIVIEAAALAMLAAAVPFLRKPARLSLREWTLAVVLLSPLWLAAVYLVPVPADFWHAGPGRSLYSELLAAAEIPRAGWLPISLAPDATTVSLLAGIPLVAAFLGGYLSSPRQLTVVLATFVCMAFAQVIFGLLQASGGNASSLYFGAQGGRPFGTFANPNHFANYLGMALVAYILLAWKMIARPRSGRDAPRDASRARRVVLWGAGAVVLLVGVLMSRSRAGTLMALAASGAALLLVLAIASRRRHHAWRNNALLLGVALAAGISLVGADALMARFDLERLQSDLPLRSIQAATTMEGVAHFWPWGAGWGTYYSVYPRFQPPTLVGVADYTHHDYVQMLFEGGVFAVLLMVAAGALLLLRAVELVRAAAQQRKLYEEQVIAALCGIALLGFLLHSLVEFNMHIPANAIIASLLAGVYLRPLPRAEGAAASREPAHD